MKKRLISIALVVALALVLVPLAAAGGGHGPKGGNPKSGGHQHGKAKFNLVGTLKAVDATAGTITVMVKAGTKTVKGFRGKDLVLVVDPQARLRIVTADGCVSVALADLPVDAKAKVRGTIDRTDPAAILYLAKDVKVKAPVETEPEPGPTESPAG